MDGDDQQQACDREREPADDRAAARRERELGERCRCEPETSEQHQQESQLGQPATGVMGHQDDHAGIIPLRDAPRWKPGS